MSWFKKMWNQGKKVDPLTHKAMETVMKFDSKGVREVSKGLGKVTGIKAFNSLSREADKNVDDPARGIGRAAASVGAVFGGMYLAGAAAAGGAGAAGAGAGAGGAGATAAAGGTGLTMGGSGLGMTAAGTAAGGTATGLASTGLGASGGITAGAAGSGLGLTASGTAAGGTATGLASTGLGASGSGAAAGGSSWMDWFNRMPSSGGGGQQRQPSKWSEIEDLPELDVPQPAALPRMGIPEFGGNDGA